MNSPPITVYRIVFHDPPAADYFQPDATHGIIPKPPLHPQSMSAWSTLARARDLARWLVRTGKRDWVAIAQVWVPQAGPFGAALDEPPSHHLALWGDAAELAAAARVVEVREARMHDGSRTTVRR